MADGWYGNYVFYRDGQKTTFGSFQESKNTWFTLAIEKQGNQINMYYNGEIKSTYTETDSAASQLIGVDAVSPWRGGSEYDYFEVWQIGDTSTQEAQQSLLSNPIVIGGIIGAVGVGVGGVLYFFVFGGGGGAAGSAAGGAGAAGSTVVLRVAEAQVVVVKSKVPFCIQRVGVHLFTHPVAFLAPYKVLKQVR